mmetsp:Transcript_10321/g.10391  ORF Transcript_10321/g.10391 Transcript_10321/m.10391 type:complete len:233 (+) Transcript_10321:61-759(+)|eukprot:CAMPEP_0182427662 /NCGR_PEP_ID=MMETSP1167-20130531/18956_1 /TAXON_ID=2988 /ORGANISM="Mallomonas Sp, Strain CCMP3275" /LENGTH=232 /DNA_ID=CAMNT_0024610055 /DNA_START=58 /DNA_END=756 /DNA_ORIENTATION=+
MSNKWFGLESNPEVMASYCGKMGLNTQKASFYDVMSVEDWALAMIPVPVYGVVFLFPINESVEEFRRVEGEKIKAEGQIVSPNVYYMRQTVANACGTVGILHAIGNARENLEFTPGSYLERFYQKSVPMSPMEIAQFLESDDEIGTIHGTAAQDGQSAPTNTDLDTHFICFSCIDGVLYELDGRKEFPINHGSSSPDTLLYDACRVVKQFMERDPDEVRFTILALAAVSDDM